MQIQVEPHHRDGAAVRVVIGRAGNTAPGRVRNHISAEDRDYRLVVVLDDGREVFGAAPECVLPAEVSTSTVTTRNGRKLTANTDPVPGIEKPWCIVTGAGTDDEFVLIECATFAEAVRKRERECDPGAADIMKRRADGSLTTEF